MKPERQEVNRVIWRKSIPGKEQQGQKHWDKDELRAFQACRERKCGWSMLSGHQKVWGKYREEGGGDLMEDLVGHSENLDFILIVIESHWNVLK